MKLNVCVLLASKMFPVTIWQIDWQLHTLSYPRAFPRALDRNLGKLSRYSKIDVAAVRYQIASEKDAQCFILRCSTYFDSTGNWLYKRIDVNLYVTDTDPHCSCITGRFLKYLQVLVPAAASTDVGSARKKKSRSQRQKTQKAI